MDAIVLIINNINNQQTIFCKKLTNLEEIFKMQENVLPKIFLNHKQS